MKSVNLVENWEFKEKDAHAQPLHVDRNGILDDGLMQLMPLCPK